ncbi:MAG: 2-oxoglutarate synthase subunit alpha [Deltaproteobacteria bacterium]|nr:MAG: 2-oxoglutarate synthase subunit alpha [Deltaproteobacteria bacterium]
MQVISTGNALVAQGAIDAGCKFFGGYPITPSSEVAHEMSRLLPKNGGTFIQMEDELSGIAVAIGSSMGGTKSMTATSGPGISLKAENIGLAFMAEVPLVIVNVMRGGPSTGLPTRVSQGDILQMRNPTHGDYASITLAAGNLAECYTQSVRAFNLANKYMTPVFLALDETLGHMYAKASLPEKSELKFVEREVYTGPKEEYQPYKVEMNKPAILNPMFKGYHYHLTGLQHGPTGFPTEDEKISAFNMQRLMGKIQVPMQENGSLDDEPAYEEFMLNDAEICIIAYGSVSLSAKDAVLRLRKEGIKAGLFRPIILWPSPAKAIRKVCDKYKHIFVPELNMGQYVQEVDRIAKRDDIHPINKANGRPIIPAEMVEHIKKVIGR